jgi:hypothetical protein
VLNIVLNKREKIPPKIFKNKKKKIFLFSFYRLYEPPVVHEDGLVLDFCGGQPCFDLVSQSLQQEI